MRGKSYSIVCSDDVAEVVELVDAQVSGTCEGFLMGVRVPPSALQGVPLFIFRSFAMPPQRISS